MADSANRRSTLNSADVCRSSWAQISRREMDLPDMVTRLIIMGSDRQSSSALRSAFEGRDASASRTVSTAGSTRCA